MVVDKLNVNYSGHQINAEPISVPENSPYKARTVHNRILKEEPSTIEIWQYSDKSGSWLTEEPYTGTVSSTGKFQVDYDGAEDGDMKFRNTILFHAAQANTEWFIWYKSVGDIYDADDFNAKVNKTTGTENNFAALDNAGGIKDSGKKADDFEPKIDPKGTAFNKNFGNATGTVCEGNDSRLSDARPPTAHKDSHITGGDDIIPNAVPGGNSGLMTGTDKQNLDDAVTIKHTQNTDQYLDFGGANQVAVGDVKDAVAKKHEHDNKTELDTYSATTANLTFYVNAATGSDENDGSSGSPFATIAKAISLIPQVVNHTVTINLADGYYSEGIDLGGYVGDGLVYIHGNFSNPENVVLSDSIYVFNCTCPIKIYGVETTIADDDGVNVSNVTHLDVSIIRVVTNSSWGQGHGLFASYANVYVSYCIFSNRNSGICSSICGNIFSSYNEGSNNNIGLEATNGGIITKSNTQPTGSTNESASYGGQIFPKETFEDITYYINPSTGDDENDGSSGSPFKTIAKAISLIPQIVNHTVTINLADGNYSEGITLTGYMGGGEIYILGNNDHPENVVIAGGITAVRCSVGYIVLNGMETTNTGSEGIYLAYCSSYFTIDHVLCDTTDAINDGLYAIGCPVVYILYSTFSNRSSGISAQVGTTVISVANYGANNDVGLYATAATIIKVGPQPGGTTDEVTDYGGVIR